LCAGGDERALFVPKRPVATKDVPHILWINDVHIALARNGSCAFNVVMPGWQLQRRLSPPPAAIPDILAIRKDAPEMLFACEIDLGGERLTATFLPKLRVLHLLLSD